MNIYVASSWRNQRQPVIVNTLRHEGHDVYDFRSPDDDDHGFHWSEIDPCWQVWTMDEYRRHLCKSPLAEHGFNTDFAAMEWADVFLGVMPFGRSASMEMGWGAGQGKRTILLLSDAEPELMVKMFDFICITMDEVCDVLQREQLTKNGG